MKKKSLSKFLREGTKQQGLGRLGEQGWILHGKGGNWRRVTDGWMGTWTCQARVLRGTSWSRWNHHESTLWFDPSSSLPSKGDMAGRCLSAWPFVSTSASESMRLACALFSLVTRWFLDLTSESMRLAYRFVGFSQAFLGGHYMIIWTLVWHPISKVGVSMAFDSSWWNLKKEY